MLKLSNRILPAAGLALVACLALPSEASAQLGATRLRVKVTNITQAQIISPVVAATHRSDMPAIFSLGEPASEELAQVAEDAVLQPLIDKLSDMPSVMDVKTITGAAGPIMPGESAEVDLEAIGPFRFVSVAAMLVTSNDAFMGLTGVRGPNLGTGVHLSPAYDAGSEANTESCDHIPGPPCGNGGVRVTDGAEGYVYVSSGISGKADIDATRYDWRNPVAKIEITRVF